LRCSRAAFTGSSRNGPAAFVNEGLWVTSAAGQGALQIGSSGLDSFGCAPPNGCSSGQADTVGTPAWNPSGTEVAVTEPNLIGPGIAKLLIWVVDAGDGRARVVPNSSGRCGFALAWRPDGKSLACWAMQGWSSSQLRPARRSPCRRDDQLAAARRCRGPRTGSPFWRQAPVTALSSCSRPRVFDWRAMTFTVPPTLPTAPVVAATYEGASIDGKFVPPVVASDGSEYPAGPVEVHLWQIRLSLPRRPARAPWSLPGLDPGSDGRTVTRKINPDQQGRYQAWFDNARKLHQLVTDLETLSLQAFEQTDGSSRR